MSADPVPPPSGVKIKRYSLRAMLRELEQDRAHKAFTMEKLDRATIDEIFRPAPPPAHGSNQSVS